MRAADLLDPQPSISLLPSAVRPEVEPVFSSPCVQPFFTTFRIFALSMPGGMSPSVFSATQTSFLSYDAPASSVARGLLGGDAPAVP